jgi:hypothetical protein
METADSYETLATTYHTTESHNPVDRSLNYLRYHLDFPVEGVRKHMKSHMEISHSFPVDVLFGS